MNYRKPLYLMTIFAFLACQNEIENGLVREPLFEEWKVIYQNDENGRQISGSKDLLIKKIKEGYPIKVQWVSRRPNDTTKTVEHVVNAEFLTISNNDVVFAQITPFLAQRPILDRDTLSITLLPKEIRWVLGSNGQISSISVDYRDGSVEAVSPRTFGYKTSWMSKVYTYKNGDQ